MKENGFSSATFESSRANNNFVSRLLLHHFLSEEDVAWFKDIPYPLTQNQKMALIFVRESGAINNQTQRQLTDGDVLSASAELRKLREIDLLKQQGKGSATYYLPGVNFPKSLEDKATKFKNPLGEDYTSLGGQHTSLRIPDSLSKRIELHTLKVRNKADFQSIIVELCSLAPRSVDDLCTILARKGADRLKRDYLTPLREEGRLEFTHPHMEKHPQQAYRATSQK